MTGFEKISERIRQKMDQHYVAEVRSAVDLFGQQLSRNDRMSLYREIAVLEEALRKGEPILFRGELETLIDSAASRGTGPGPTAPAASEDPAREEPAEDAGDAQERLPRTG